MAYEDYEAVIGLEVHVQLLTETKMFCRCPNRFGAAPEHARLPGLPRLSGHAAGAEPPCGRPRGEAGAGARVRGPRRRRSSPARTTSIRTCPRAIRSASSTARWPRTGCCRWPSTTRECASSASISRRTPASSCTRRRAAGRCRARAWWTSTAAACRWSRSSRGPTCRRRRSPGLPPDPPSAPPLHRDQRRQHGGGEPALRRQRLGAAAAARPGWAPRRRSRTSTPSATSPGPIEHEIERQIALLESGGRVVQETRSFDAEHRHHAADAEQGGGARLPLLPGSGPAAAGRYARSGWRRSAGELPELPWQRRARFVAQYGLPAADAQVLTASRELADYYEAAAAALPANPKGIANWVMGEVLRDLKERKVEISALRSPPSASRLWSRMVDAGQDLEQRRQGGVRRVWRRPARSRRRRWSGSGLAQVSRHRADRALDRRGHRAEPGPVAQYRAGKAQIAGLPGRSGDEALGRPRRAEDRCSSSCARRWRASRRGVGRAGTPAIRRDPVLPRHQALSRRPDGPRGRHVRDRRAASSSS